MKHTTKITSSILVAPVVLSALPVSALAAEANTPKEEVVYSNLEADGSVKEIYVVNIFDTDKTGTIIDYGNYESLRNMTTTDSIDYNNEQITIDTDAPKLYCEGKLSSTEMPWIISIKYYMDGKEYTADEIAGMSGKLELKMAIRQNTKCDSSFFEGYALQTTFVLDTKHASDITADGATMANVGSDKQITYTILPNTEKDITISANVTDFEMDAIAINGIRMNLDIDIDSADLQGKINDMIGAVNNLDTGADKLNDGALDLYDATGVLDKASGKLYTGVGSLYQGSSDLKTGLETLTGKSDDLTTAAWSAYEALCTAAETQLNAALTEKGLDTVTLTPETYSDVLLDVLAQMDADTVYTQAYNAALTEVTAQVNAQADTLYIAYINSQADERTLFSLTDKEKKEIRDGYISQMMASEEVTGQINDAVKAVSTSAAEISKLKGQLDNYGTFYDGLVDYTDAVDSAATGAGTLTDGLSSLYDNTDTLSDSIGELHDAVGTLQDGTDELKGGTGEFADEVSGMDTQVDDEIDSMTSDLTGKDIETISFVSEQNTNVKSVQFVIQTESIDTQEDEEAVVEEEEHLSFWQKLVQLFR